MLDTDRLDVVDLPEKLWSAVDLSIRKHLTDLLIEILSCLVELAGCVFVVGSSRVDGGRRVAAFRLVMSTISRCLPMRR